MKRQAYSTLLLLMIASLLLLAAPNTVLADGSEDEITKTVQGYHVALRFEKPVAIGVNPILIRVHDSQDNPVANADVLVSLVAGEGGHNEAEAAGHSDADTHPEAVTHTEAAAHSESENHAQANTQTETDTHSEDEMTGMSGMTAESHETLPASHDEMVMLQLEQGHASGEYAGEIAINSAGAWIIRVHLTIHGEMMEVDFPISTAAAKNGAGVLAGFLVINTTIISAALVTKHKVFAKKINPEVQS